jgi:hypothetical protein
MGTKSLQSDLIDACLIPLSTSLYLYCDNQRFSGGRSQI